MEPMVISHSTSWTHNVICMVAVFLLLEFLAFHRSQIAPLAQVWGKDIPQARTSVRTCHALSY